MPPIQPRIDTYIRENSGTINITNNKVGRPPIPQSKDDILRARIDPLQFKEVMAFIRGRRLTQADYIRTLASLDNEYFDHIDTLNDPEFKQFVLHALKLYKKN